MRLLIGIIFICFFVEIACQADEFDMDRFLNKKVTLSLSGSSFNNAIQKASEVTGMDIIPLDSVSKNRSSKEKIYLSVSEMPVKQFLDWFAGTLDAKYRLYSDGRVYLSENYEWVEVKKFGMLFIDLKKMVLNSQELEQFDNNLSEITKIITLFDDNYYLRIEEQADMIKLVAHIPQELKPIFIKLIEQLNKPGVDIGKLKLSSNSELDKLRLMLGKIKKVNYPYLPLNVIITKLEEDYGVNIGCSSSIFTETDSVPKISLKLGEVTLKEAIECIIEKTSLNGAEYSLPNGVWLTKYNSEWQEVVSRRFLWSDTIVLRSYNLGKFDMMVSGDKIVDQIVNNVAVRAWFDPLASVLFHEKSGNLIVLADNQTQNKVLTALKELSKRLEKK